MGNYLGDRLEWKREVVRGRRLFTAEWLREGRSEPQLEIRAPGSTVLALNKDEAKDLMQLIRAEIERDYV